MFAWRTTWNYGYRPLYLEQTYRLSWFLFLIMFTLSLNYPNNNKVNINIILTIIISSSQTFRSLNQIYIQTAIKNCSNFQDLNFKCRIPLASDFCSQTFDHLCTCVSIIIVFCFNIWFNVYKTHNVWFKN